MPASRLVILSVCAGTLFLGSIGQSAADEARSCVTIADGAARLACYDRAFGRPAAGPTTAASARSTAVPAAAPPTTPAAVTAVAPAVPVAPKNPVAEFGLTEAGKQAKDPVKAAEAAAAPESVSGKVISVQWRKYGEFVVTLDNGQVWAQNEPMPSAIVRVGDTVTVKKAWLGSYMLVTAGRVGTKVHRTD